jgi:hypothetical protein
MSGERGTQDVIEVEIAAPHTERMLATRNTEQEAEAIIRLAVMRRGVATHFYVMRPSRTSTAL